MGFLGLVPSQFSPSLFVCLFLSFFLLRETERKREREREREREGAEEVLGKVEREGIPSRLHAVSAEPDVGFNLMNP